MEPGTRRRIVLVHAVQVAMDPVDAFHLPDGTRFTVPPDLDTYLARIKSHFPQQAAAIDSFFEAVRREYLTGLLRHFRGHEPPGGPPRWPSGRRRVVRGRPVGGR